MNYDKRAVPDSLGEDFWFSEKTTWYQDHVMYGKPYLEVYSLTVSGGDPVRGIAPNETLTKRVEYPCSITSPTEEELTLGIMQEQDRRIIFYIDREDEQFPDNVEQIRVNGVSYEIITMQNETESGRCEITGKPSSAVGRAGI